MSKIINSILVNNGDINNPSYSFINSTNTGLFYDSATGDDLYIVAGGVSKFIACEGDSDDVEMTNGKGERIICDEGGTGIDLYTGGILNSRFNTTEITFKFPIKGQDGTETIPFYSFESDADTGLYRVSDNYLALTTGGENIIELNGNTTNITDIIIGKTTTAGTNNLGHGNYLRFSGTLGDINNTHTTIAERIYEDNTEKSELLLFKGNDIDDVSGLDRIRCRAAEIVFQTYETTEEVIGSSVSDNNTRLSIETDSIDSFLPIHEIDGNINKPSYSFTSNSNTGLIGKMVPSDFTERDIPVGNLTAWQDVFYSENEGYFVACGTGDVSQSYQYIMRSPEGITWTVASSIDNSAASDMDCQSISYSTSLSRFVVVGNSSSDVLYSDDGGDNWSVSSNALSQTNNWGSITYSSSLDLFVVVSSNGTNRVATSTDAITWTLRDASAARSWNTVIWAEGFNLFISINNSGLSDEGIMTSPTGVTWTSRASEGPVNGNTIGYSTDLNLAIIGLGGFFTNPPHYSVDGISWTLFNFSVNVNTTISDIGWFGNNFFFAARGLGEYIYSHNGFSWFGGNVGHSNNLTCVTYSDSLQRIVVLSETNISSSEINTDLGVIVSGVNTFSFSNNNVNVGLDETLEFNGFYEDLSDSGPFRFINTSLKTDSDDNPTVTIEKGSVTTSSSQVFMQFFSNAGAQTMGGIVGNGSSNVQFVSISDSRYKQNITPFTTSILPELYKLNLVSFDWINNGEHASIGLIANDVEEVFPELVSTRNDLQNGYNDVKELTGGITSTFSKYLLKAIQELYDEVNELKEGLLPL